MHLPTRSSFLTFLLMLQLGMHLHGQQQSSFFSLPIIGSFAALTIACCGLGAWGWHNHTQVQTIKKSKEKELAAKESARQQLQDQLQMIQEQNAQYQQQILITKKQQDKTEKQLQAYGPLCSAIQTKLKRLEDQNTRLKIRNDQLHKRLSKNKA